MSRYRWTILALGTAALSGLPPEFRPPFARGEDVPTRCRVVIAAAIGLGSFHRDPADWGPGAVMALWPRTVAHVICGSLGYATPSLAARILADAKARRPSYCEWIDSCYARDAHRAVQHCVRGRHGHRGIMAEYRNAIALVRRAVNSGKEPVFASWF